MIACAVCRHDNMEGEYFCQECGARLVLDWAPGGSPTRMGEPAPTAKRPDVLASLLPGQIALFISGSREPVILEGRSEYFLGRDNSPQAPQELDLNDYGGREKGVSRVHAALRHDRHRVLLVDMGSTNGTRLNGSLLPANTPAAVEDGDEIRLGKLSITVNFVP